MGFWGSLWGGSSPDLNSDIGQSKQNAGWDTGQGQSDVTAGTDFLKSILGGDASKQAQALAPEISAAKTSAQNSNKTAAEMGTRSGGTAATTAKTNDSLHAYITDLIGKLTGSAATALPQIGTALTGQGESALMDNAKLAEQRQQNWANSILGHGVISGVQSAEELGEQYLAGPGQTSAADTYGPGGAI